MNDDERVSDEALALMARQPGDSVVERMARELVELRKMAEAKCEAEVERTGFRRWCADAERSSDSVPVQREAERKSRNIVDLDDEGQHHNVFIAPPPIGPTPYRPCADHGGYDPALPQCPGCVAAGVVTVARSSDAKCARCPKPALTDLDALLAQARQEERQRIAREILGWCDDPDVFDKVAVRSVHAVRSVAYAVRDPEWVKRLKYEVK